MVSPMSFQKNIVGHALKHTSDSHIFVGNIFEQMFDEQVIISCFIGRARKLDECSIRFVDFIQTVIFYLR
jgi:hypothetical protein